MKETLSNLWFVIFVMSITMIHLTALTIEERKGE